MPKTQVCSTDDCINNAAFTTRTKPAWCTDCLIGILHEMNMEPAVPFPGKNERWLTRCRDCNAECHYRLDYLLELRTRDNEPPCRFCFWTQWAEEANRTAGLPVYPFGVDELRELMKRNGFEPVHELVPLPSGSHPVLTRCIHCGIQQAERPGDIGWGCTCTRNTVSSHKPAGSRKAGGKDLFADSDNEALKWWDHERNSEDDFRTITLKARREVSWVCPQCEHRFFRKVYQMTDMYRTECPMCEEKRSRKWGEERARLKQTPASEVPELLAAWADDADPREVMVADGWQLRRFKCPNGHYPRVRPETFLSSGCPSCRSQATVARHKPMLADVLPEIAGQWHPTRNGKWTLQNMGPESKRRIWWKTDCCGHEWQEPVVARNKYKRQRCPQCFTILDSLAWYDPGLAAEWSDENPVTPWHVRPHAQTGFIPKWVCAVNPLHIWEAPLASRSNGSECPDCRQTGKSRVELDHLAAAKTVFGKVRSGANVRDKAFSSRKVWSVDILAEHDGTKVAIEYDGAYWHGPEPKQLVDRSKSLDLLAAGYLLVRLREDDLPQLSINSDDYLEIRVYSRAPRSDAIMAAAAAWVEARQMEEAASKKFA